jgi:hypothetical protein
MTLQHIGASALLLAAACRLVSGYPTAIHERLPDVLLQYAFVRGKAAMPPQAGIDAFRQRFYSLAAVTASDDVRRRLLLRYPKAADFTAQAFKELLGMSAIHAALGFDGFEAIEGVPEPVMAGQERPIIDWIRLGSTLPDLDRRNQDRWWAPGGTLRRTAHGERIPYDPVVLNMGGVAGLAGQAHAHYALNRNPKSDDPAVLKTRPADFAIRAGFAQAPVLTFAPERAQAYADLAIIAYHLGEPALAAVFAGNAFHYVADAANQIHTLQVGVYDFFRDATLAAWKEKLLTLGGLLRQPLPRNQIGLDMLTNHHTWSEEMFRVAFERAAAGKPVHPSFSRTDDVFETDAACVEAWNRLPRDGPALVLMMDAVIAAGNKEAPEVYALVRNLTSSKLRQTGVRIDFDRQPDAVVLGYLKPGADSRMLARFFELERLGTRRAATVIALWWQSRFPSDRKQLPAILDGLLKRQLDEMDQADARRNVWVAGQRAAGK